MEKVPDCHADAPVFLRHGDDDQCHSHRVRLSHVDAVRPGRLHGLLPHPFREVLCQRVQVIQANKATATNC